MPFEPGQRIGRYRVVRLIAQGGMAEVYRADQELAGGIFRPAALKVIRPEYSESPDFREMFLDEARTAATLSHPNIVHIYDVGEWEGTLYMAMELVPGETLAVVGRTLRQSERRFSDEALLAIGIFTCSALEAVHALHLPGEGHVNLVHRDVSPHNLLLSSGGSLKLIDFGISKAATNRNLTNPGVTKGKAGYFSPEQAMGKQLDGRSDIFSLGVTLYKLASGATPFDQHPTVFERNTALVHGRWVNLDQVCPGLPPGLYEVVSTALKVRPEQRFITARQMREALERVALESGVHVGPSSLIGYVSDEGEISSTPSKKVVAIRPPPEPALAPTRVDTLPVPPAPAAPARPPHRPTERVAPVDAPPVWRSLGFRGVLWTLLAMGVGMSAVMVSSLWWSEPMPPPPPAKPPPALENLEPEPPLAVPPPPALAEPEEPVEPVQPVEAPKPPRKVPRLKSPKKGASMPAAAQPPSAEEERKVNQGEGRLRVGSSPDSTVTVGEETLGVTPLDRKVRAGPYTVHFRAPDGREGRCGARVVADRITIVFYDFATGRCR